ncbi:hypothetical protein [Dactylosporangium sp. NPDC049140]|jgi:hypothetical protein|uniref:hypothetical protein n=1 Tax=Dactylosporangium sp. NPDC049140 TaxID=3155647 RepID=UPI0033ED65E6
MSTDDKDLMALRGFRRDLDDPPEGVLVRGRYRLAGSEHRPPTRRRQWLLASAGAAAALTVVVGAAAAVNSAGNRTDGGGQAPAQGPATAAGRPSTGATADLPVTIGTRAPLDAKVTSDGGATHAKAVAAMDRLANAAAGGQPLAVPAGQALYVKTYNLVPGAEKYIHEIWMDPSTLAPLRIRRTDGDQTTDMPSTQDEIDQATAQAPGLYRPTADYLASLPADPAQLISRWRQWAQTTYPDRPADGMIWKDVFELVNYSEPFWTPQQRATIYKAFALMPDLKATTAKIDNRPYDLVCIDREPNGGGTIDCDLFDSATGRYAGTAWPEKNLALKPGSIGLVDYGTQPRPAVGVRASTPPKTTGSPHPGKS